jgi:hypothetical protein
LDFHSDQAPLLAANPSAYPWPPFKHLTFNELYWPCTGACRWARCYLLATADVASAIIKDGPSESVTGKGLVIEEPISKNKITVTMFALPPRPISAYLPGKSTTPAAQHLWVIPLVDRRYWWQYRSTNEMTAIVQGTTTWTDLFETIRIQLGLPTLNVDSVSSDYLYPDTETLTRFQHSSAALLDAAASSVGMRVVVDITGITRICGPATGSIEYLVNQNSTSYTMGGGGPYNLQNIGGLPQQLACSVPSEVNVAFRRRDSSTRKVVGIKSYTKSPAAGLFSAGQLIAQDTRGPRKYIRSACYADGLSGTPANDTKLTALAAKISTDYYASLAYWYDFNINGLAQWSPCFHDDYITYSIGSLRRRHFGIGQYAATTRVRSLPENFYPEDQFQQDSFPILEPASPYDNPGDGQYPPTVSGSAIFNVGKTSGVVTARNGSTNSGYGSVIVWKTDGSHAMTASSTTVTVENTFAEAIPDGKFVQIAVDTYGKWWIVSAEC